MKDITVIKDASLELFMNTYIVKDRNSERTPGNINFIGVEYFFVKASITEDFSNGYLFQFIKTIAVHAFNKQLTGKYIYEIAPYDSMLSKAILKSTEIVMEELSKENSSTY